MIPKDGAFVMVLLLSKNGCKTPTRNFSWSEKISAKICTYWYFLSFKLFLGAKIKNHMLITQ